MASRRRSSTSYIRYLALKTKTMAAWLDITLLTIYYISQPIVWISKLILQIIILIASPFVYLGNSVLQLCLIPVHVLAKFEAVWKFLGTAVLIGAITGALLHLFCTALFKYLNLNGKDEPVSMVDITKIKGHTAASYRAARQQKKMHAQTRQAMRSRWLAATPMLGLGGMEERQSDLSAHARKTAARAPTELLSTTILEEMSSTSSVETKL